MIIKVLGSAAGGGFPQWNCNAPTSRLAWLGDPRASRRSQTSLAVSAGGGGWLLLNASPDIRQQIAATPVLQPGSGGPLRNSPIRAVVLTGADVDQIAGLLSLRERQPLSVYATFRVLDVIAKNSIFDVLSADHVGRMPLALGEPSALVELGLTIEAFAVPGKIALYLEHTARAGGELGTREGDTIGLEITDTDTQRSFLFVPSCAVVDDGVRERLRGADLVFFDGTLYSDDELVRQGLSDKTGRRMGHVSMAGEGGSLAALADLDIGRRIYVHINTSNPVLIEGSPERAAVEEAGWEIAHDGLEVRL